MDFDSDSDLYGLWIVDVDVGARVDAGGSAGGQEACVRMCECVNV